MLLCVTLRGDALASADTAFVYQYALVNTLRWAVNCATVLLAVDWARSACAASPVDRGFDASAVLVSSISFGLALTLPFSLGVAGEPQQQHQATGTDWWIVYGEWQALTSTIVDAVVAVSLLGCLAIVAVSRQRPHKGSDPAAVSAMGRCDGVVNAASAVAAAGAIATTGTAPPVALVRPLRTTEYAAPLGAASLASEPRSYTVPLGVMLTVAAIRSAGNSALCSRIVSLGTGSLPIGQASSSAVELLLVLVLLEDGQGLLSFFLFGLEPAIFALIRSCLCKRPAGQEGLDDETETRDSTGVGGAMRLSLSRQAQHVLAMYAPSVDVVGPIGGTTSESSCGANVGSAEEVAFSADGPA